MVSSISGGPPPPPQGGFGGASSVTSEQASAVADLLSDYDAEGLSEEDAQSIVSQIKELGIKPGAGLADTLAASGFDAQDLAETAGLSPQGGPPGGGKGGPPPGGGQQGQVNSEAIAALNTLIEAADGEDISEDDLNALISDLETSGLDLSKGFVNVQV